MASLVWLNIFCFFLFLFLLFLSSVFIVLTNLKWEYQKKTNKPRKHKLWIANWKLIVGEVQNFCSPLNIYDVSIWREKSICMTTFIHPGFESVSSYTFGILRAVFRCGLGSYISFSRQTILYVSLLWSYLFVPYTIIHIIVIVNAIIWTLNSVRAHNESLGTLYCRVLIFFSVLYEDIEDHSFVIYIVFMSLQFKKEILSQLKCFLVKLSENMQ